MRNWRESWRDLQTKNPDPELPLPSGKMEPAGYIVLQHAIRADRRVRAYRRWMQKIPNEYRSSVLNTPASQNDEVEGDSECLATLKHYRSLMPLAMEVHKPMFFLKPADGAIGAHVEAVRGCFEDFERLATKIAKRCSIPLRKPDLFSF